VEEEPVGQGEASELVDMVGLGDGGGRLGDGVEELEMCDGSGRWRLGWHDGWIP
jgi:hypothetical protein